VEQFSNGGRKHWSQINNPEECAQKEDAEWVEYYSFLELAEQYTTETEVRGKFDRTSSVRARNARLQPHPLANIFLAELVRFGKIWLDLSEFWAKLRRNLGKSD